MNHIMTLGDAGADNSDAGYTGDTGDAVASMQYFRNKATQFQEVMNQLDRGYIAASQLVEFVTNEQDRDDLIDLLAEFEEKKSTLRITAEAINAGAYAVNAIGGRFPQLSIPMNLNGYAEDQVRYVSVFGPIVGSAVASAANLVSWGVDWLARLAGRVSAMDVANETDPVKQEILARQLEIQNAADAATDSPLSNIAGIVKWGAIAVLGFMAFSAFQKASR